MLKIVVLLHIYFSKEQQLLKKYFETFVFTVTSSQCFDRNKLLNSLKKN